VKRILALGALVLLLGLCVGAWWVQTADAMGLVEVHTARPVCSGAAVDADRTIQAQRGMACTVRITLSNSGSRTVHVRGVGLPSFGSQGRWVVQAGPSTSQRIQDHGVDATLPIDQDLDSGDLLQFDVTLAYRPGGCSGGTDSGIERVQHWPTVTVGFLGRSVDRSGDGELRFSQAGPARGCQQG
jgi:hypothetical protein